MPFTELAENLRRKRYEVAVFNDKIAAAQYLEGKIKAKSVGFGDSQTLKSMNLQEILSKNNTVVDPALAENNDEFLRLASEALNTQIFILSVNAISAGGEIVNIDGTGNRAAGSLYNHEKVFFVIGRNKIEPTLEKAVWRARNVAAPLNAKRLGLRTPCALKGDRCYDCKSPDRICNGVLIHLRKMNDMAMEAVLINEDLGF